MTESPVQRALAASTASLVVAVACLALFLPPMVVQTTGSVWRSVAAGLAMATAMLLHWVFLAITARRMGRSTAGWVALSLLLFPVGSVAAVVLLGWFRDDAERTASAA